MASPLTTTLAFALLGQLLPALVFVPLKTEKYYDLCGSLGFLSTTVFSLYLTPKSPSLSQAVSNPSVLGLFKSSLSSLLIKVQSASSAAPRPDGLFFGRHPRQWLASACIAIWAVRLGSYLFTRIHRSGRDPRFDKIKHKPSSFSIAWAMQGVWIGLTALPVYLMNAMPAASHAPLNIYDGVAMLVWAAGMTLEVVADRTKSQWRSEKEAGKHKEKLLTRGVWSWSRHPNYFGEIMLWTGLAMLSSFVLSTPAGRAHFGGAAGMLPLISPLFEYGLIRYISGVPMLEESMDKKHKGDDEYKRYKSTVPCFVPIVGSKA